MGTSFRARILQVAAAVIVVAARSASAELLVLDRASVVTHAKTTAPSAKIAAGAVNEAKARTIGVGTVSLERPTVTILGGRRLASPESSKSLPEYGASLLFPLDLGGRPGARVDAANAELDATKADTADRMREIVREALPRYVRALGSESMLTMVMDRREMTSSILAIAKRRVAAGDVAETEVNLVLIELGRDDAKLAAAQGEVDTTTLSLTAFIGVAGAPKITGSLTPGDEPEALETLLAGVDARSDVKAARAAEAATTTSVDLAKADRWPTIGLVGSWSYGELAHTFTFGVQVPLPPLNGNKTTIAVSEAKATNAKTRTASVREQAEKELRAAYARYTTAKDVVDALAKTGGLLAHSLDKAQKAYDGGKLSLGDVMLTRRAVAEAVQEKLAADVALAEARIELDAASGRLP